MGLPDQIELPYAKGYDFGIGVNLSTGGAKAQAVEGEISGVGDFPAGSFGFEITRIRTTSEIEDVLGISASANAGFASFGAGAEARFSFARRARVQRSSLVMLITAFVLRGFQQIDQPALNKAALLVFDNPSLFEQRCGNMFVRGISGGGFFIAYLRIDTGSDDLSQKIAGELGGSYKLFSAEAKANFEKIQRDYRNETEIKAYAEGGPISGIQDLDDPLELLRKLNEFLQSFAERPAEVAKPYSVTLAPLTIANAPPPPNTVDVERASDVLVFCARRRSTLIDQLNTYQYVVDHPDRFDFSNGANLDQISTAAQAAQDDLDLIASCASRAMNSPARAKLPEPYAAEEGKEYPKLTVPNPLPIAKQVVTEVPAGNFRVPSFLGTSVVDIHDALIALLIAGFAPLLDGDVLGGGGGLTLEEIINLPTTSALNTGSGSPLKLNRDLLVFLRESGRGGINLNPPDISLDSQNPAWGKVKSDLIGSVVGDQTPSPGSIVPNGTDILLEFM